MGLQPLAVFFLGTVAAGGVAWVFIYPTLSGARQAEKRKEIMTRSEPASRTPAARSTAKSRREQIEGSLKEIELRNRRRSVPLTTRISQAGLGWSKRQFILISAGLGMGLFLMGLILGTGLLASLLAGFAGALGIPRWLLSFLKKQREARFLNTFPDAVDVIVRGVKAGLPLADCLKVIANESQEPVKSEFQAILATQAIGIPIGEACAKLYESIHLPEANFFGIVISIQQKAGGNLSETLGNLSRVLRDRKKMQAKIKAMSMEAKASATIIGALPVVVMALVYLSSPTYIELLWTTPLGRLLLAGCAGWMLIGILVMRKMINFDF